MASVSKKANAFFKRLQTLYHEFATAGRKSRLRSDHDHDFIFDPGEINVSRWKKMDSRSLGIDRKMIPLPPYLVVKILQSRGFEAYFVGGCVRDLLLNRTPKDFDVITTADLNQIKKQFYHCMIVGRIFPVCRVHIKDSVIEVTSFNTIAKHSQGKENFLISQMPEGCDKSDLNLWKNSMHRDFTVNSLFFDPLVHKIYDYNDGMKDLSELKLRTLVPAHLSFTEDCARILRGLRIAARLGLSFSKDIQMAIHEHASSILDLSKERLMLELNYMLSFGAAESSLSLLHRFHLLKVLLPFQAAYISQQATRSGQSSMMLMKLFFHLDQLVTCDQPSDCRLWIGLLAFHLALVNNSQHPFVVLTLASVLYHQNWEEGLQFARQCGRAPVSFDPEISGSHDFISDDELAERVNKLANLVVDSVDVLADADNLHKAMAKFPDYPCSDLVFIPKKMVHGAAQLFHVLTHNVKTYKKGRTSFELDLDLLGKGDTAEARFALGKIILNTMACGVDQAGETIKENYHSPSSPKNEHDMGQKMQKRRLLSPSNSNLQQRIVPKKQKRVAQVSSTAQHSKKQNAATEKKSEDHVMEKPESSREDLICMLETVIGDEKSRSQVESQKQEKKLEETIEVEVDHQLIAGEPKVKRKRKRKTKLLKTVAGDEKPVPQSETKKQKEKPVVDPEVKEGKSIEQEQSVKRKQERKRALPLSALFK